MKPHFFIVIMAYLAVQSSIRLNAQAVSVKPVFEKNDVQISEGILSLAEAEGWAGVGGLYRGIGLGGNVSMPDGGTGALFITYKSFITRRFALGVTVGLDNETGNLTYADQRFTSSNDYGEIGRYRVHSYSLAIEPLLAYKRKHSYMFYGYLGIGITSYENKSTFKAGIHNPDRFYGPNGMVPTNPYTYREINFTGQITPIGFRFGRKIAAFIEIGFGYKGLISAGLSAKF